MNQNPDPDYIKYRGKCREFCEKEFAKDSTLKIVRGHYYCPIWNSNEQHWWLKRSDGSIFDPTAKQFPSKGMGVYTEFDGWLFCEKCEKKIHENDKNIIFYSRYVYCSGKCLIKDVL